MTKPIPVFDIITKRQKLSLPKKWSHQAELESMIGQEIVMERVGGGHTAGVLIAVDRFALQLCVRAENGHKSIWTVFKHDARAFALLSQATSSNAAPAA